MYFVFVVVRKFTLAWLEFCSSVTDFHLPFDAMLSRIDLFVPDSCWFSKLFYAVDAAAADTQRRDEAQSVSAMFSQLPCFGCSGIQHG